MLKALQDEVRWLPVDVSSVRLEADSVVIEFTTDARPGCRFAYSEPALTDNLDVLRNDTPGMYATEIRVHLQEQIEAVGHGLPEDCTPGDLTWIA